MLAVKGIYKDGKIELLEPIKDVEEAELLIVVVPKDTSKGSIEFDKILKETIFHFTEVHYKTFHAEKTFIPGETRINYAGRAYDEKEMINLVDSALDFWLTAGRFEKEFVEKLSEFLDVKHVITTNSGSSANLLAISALTSYKLGDRRLKPGDEVITVAAGFPTTVAPIIQNNLVPVFVDIDIGTYNIDTKKLEKAVSEKTRAIFFAHTLGMPFNLDKAMEFAQKYNLWVIEDNCDALGTKWDGTYTGTIGHLGTLSFYPAHHITMGEGGAVITDDTQLKQIVTSFRDWGRDCWCDPGKDDTCGKRFGWQLGTLPSGYDHKYTYSHLGYNLKITDMQAAVGVAQLDKLPEFIKKRQENWGKLYQGLKEFEEFFILPEVPSKAEASPFGFVLTIRDEAPFDRKAITAFLEGRKIQTRTVFAGNIIRQPAFTEGNISYRIVEELKNTDKVMMDTFWLGVYPGMTEEMIKFTLESFEEFIKNKPIS
jgi:CDP-6-deoxy-D-xylo-4-hexulose-3-dehydrase